MVLQDQEIYTQAFPWFALRVRSNHERMAAMYMKERGYEQFSPSYKAERQWSDRKKTTEQLLFPGYVFCRFDPSDRLPVLMAPGVVDVVRFGNTLTSIPEDQIEHVRTLVSSGLPVTPLPFLEIGQPVAIEHGPLAGAQGILKAEKGKYRLVVSIHLLQRSVSTEIERGWIRPLGPSSAKQEFLRESETVSSRSF